MKKFSRFVEKVSDRIGFRIMVLVGANAFFAGCLLVAQNDPTKYGRSVYFLISILIAAIVAFPAMDNLEPLAPHLDD